MTVNSQINGPKGSNDRVAEVVDYCKRRKYDLFAYETSYDGFYQVYLAIDEKDGLGITDEGALLEEFALYRGEWKFTPRREGRFKSPKAWVKSISGTSTSPVKKLV